MFCSNFNVPGKAPPTFLVISLSIGSRANLLKVNVQYQYYCLFFAAKSHQHCLLFAISLVLYKTVLSSIFDPLVYNTVYI